jgi:hypothetical protein
MNAADFRRLALNLEDAQEGSHMGAADFRVGGHIFATLAAERHGYGNLMLTPEQQAAFVAEQPDIFLPVGGAWGANGATHVRLALVTEDVLLGALRSAWKARIEKNQVARNRATDSARKRSAARAGNREATQDNKRRKADLRAKLTTPEVLESVKERYGLND